MAVKTIPTTKLGIGFETVPLNDDTLQERITAMLQNNVQEMDIWVREAHFVSQATN
jgi:hypothetical protein